ncbi:MAG TPA: hypothetical protein VFK05_23880 [Polyangiaceae bacterium]|nr:hypothetical protein [Polyangiaceae bacterium]
MASCLADPPKKKSAPDDTEHSSGAAGESGDQNQAGHSGSGAGGVPSMQPGNAGASGDSGDGDGGASGDGGAAGDSGATAGAGATAGNAAGGNAGAGAGGPNAGSGGGAVCSAANNTCTDPSTLKQCKSDGSGFEQPSMCLGGCTTTPTPHCAALTPSAPVLASDLKSTTVQAITASSGVILLNTDTGAISGGLTRSANLVATQLEVNAGIGYRQASDGTGIFVFQSLTVAAGATLKLVGTAPVALVTNENLLVYGLIDGRPMDSSGALCAVGSSGPGGKAGGASGMPGPTPKSGVTGGGPGGGGGGVLNIQGNPGAGAGAGHFKTGGNGGAGCHTGSAAEPGGTGGVSYVSGLRGGSGGGGGGSYAGGGGGGALQLVAGQVLTIGDGSNIGGVNVGGCGGKGGGLGAGGGGSGGSILLEGLIVQVRPKGTLAANGGGGGGASDGQEGQLSSVRALGSGSSLVSPLAGDGGSGDSPAGTNATFACGSGTESLGGGGATGTIRILAAGGTPTVNAQAVLSPSASSGGATLAAATLN